MSRQRKRIPTSAELESRGIASVPDVGTGQPRRGVLRRLFRASRFRVPDQVAATRSTEPPPPSREGFYAVASVFEEEVPAQAPAATEPLMSSGHVQSSPEADGPPTDPVKPRRTIRISDSVRAKRGRGHDGRS